MDYKFGGVIPRGRPKKTWNEIAEKKIVRLDYYARQMLNLPHGIKLKNGKRKLKSKKKRIFSVNILW